MPFEDGQGGAITSAEAFVLAVMTAILVAIAAPSYITMQNRSNDASARAELREAADALDARRAEGAPASSIRRCLERTVGGRTWHVTMPARAIERGACP